MGIKIYMNPQKGANGNPGTPEAPVKDFQEALKALPQGGTIYIEGVLTTYESKIRIKNCHYSEVIPLVIDGQGKTDSAQQLSVQDSSHVVIKNMKCYGGAELNNTIKSKDLCLSHVTFERIKFKYGRIFAGGYTYNNITIKNCIIEEHIYSGKETHGIYFSGGHWEGSIGLPCPHDINIIGNTIRFCGGRHGIQVNGCFEQVRVKGNRIYCSNFTGFQGIGIKGCEVAHNEILIGQRGCLNIYDYWDGHYFDPNDPNVYEIWQQCHHPNQQWWIHHNTFLVGPHEWCWWQAGPTYVKGRPAILFNNELHGTKFYYPDIGKEIVVQYPPASHLIENNLIVSPWPNMIEFHEPYSCWVTTVMDNMFFTYEKDSVPIACFNSDVPIDPKVYTIEWLQENTQLYQDNILDIDPQFRFFPEFPHATQIPGMNYQMPPNASYDWSCWPGKFDLSSKPAEERGKGRPKNFMWSQCKITKANKTHDEMKF